MKYDFETLIDRRGTGACKLQAITAEQAERGIVPMTIADMEFSTAPEIQKALEAAVKHGICGYTEPDSIYRNALDGFMQRRHNFDTSKAKLVCTSGVVPAFGIVIRALTEEGDGIIVQPPVYTPFFDAININKRRILENPLINNNGHYVMDIEGLERLCKNGAKLLMLCSPHNPVGRVWSRGELMQVSEICKKYGVFVLCDEIHQDIVYDGYEHTVFANMPGMDKLAITCTAMSKTFNLAGLMLSNIFVFDEELYKKIDKQVAQDGSHCIPFFGRAAAITAFTECDAWIDELLATLSENFQYCYNYIEKNMPGISCTRAEGTYLLWLDCSGLGLDNNGIKCLFDSAELPVNIGTMFGTGSDGFVRLNIALPKKQLAEALSRLKNAVDGIKYDA